METHRPGSGGAAHRLAPTAPFAPLRAGGCATPPPPGVPPRRQVPGFPPIRRGSGGRHRLQQAVRHRPGFIAAGLLAAATALTAGPLRPGPPPPTAAPAAASEPLTGPRCPDGAPPVH
ncbi:hypothetical protein [Kitasatospora sp. NPDC059571]|uniref:hypothetical protein n=1 Tax=Kitasatospora sp. NPDC059571 TaxID=3346871 RepID=UPI0036D00DAC